MLDLKDYAEMAYAFMTGIPQKFGGGGFCLMGPEELKKQRITYVQFWMRLLNKDLQHLNKK